MTTQGLIESKMAEFGADVVEVIVSEGVPILGYKTFAPRGFHLYSSTEGYKGTVLWGMDAENKPTDGS